MAELLSQVAQLRSWCAQFPPERLNGELECCYENWVPLYAAVLEFVDSNPLKNWSDEELSAVLYATARDNEMEYLSSAFVERGAGLVLDLAEAAARLGGRDAKWQFAHQLGNLSTESVRRESLLLTLAGDDDEYVRRRSLDSLSRIGSPATEGIALDAWHRPDEHQEWARMMALWALRAVGSSEFPQLLEEAIRDERPYLSDYAKKFLDSDADKS